MSHNITLYSGYANSGKSSRVNVALEKLGYTILSTSQELDIFTDNLFQVLFDSRFNNKYRNAHYQANISKTLSDKIKSYNCTGGLKSRRQLKIDLAEKVLVKQFDREIFARAVAKKAVALLDQKHKVAIESVGGEEAQIILEYLETRYISPRLFNVRASVEKPGVDLRKLLIGVPEINTDTDVMPQLKKLLTSD